MTNKIFKKTAIAQVVAALFSVVGLANAVAQTPAPTTTFEYDANGNLSYAVDGLKHRTDYKYDALGRLKSEELPAPSVGEIRPLTTLQLDGLDQVSSVTDPRKLVTEYTNEGNGDQRILLSPDTGKTQRTFDANGNVKTVTDARGAVMTYTYDALNRVTRDEMSDGNVTIFEYDGGLSAAPNAKGHLTKMTDPTGETQYTYLQSGRLESKVQKVVVAGVTSVFKTAYAYGTSGTAAGKTTSMTYPSGTKVNFVYGPSGRILSLSVNPMNTNGIGTNTSISVPLLKNIRHTAYGAVAGWDWGNSSDLKPNKVERNYDLDGRLQSYNLGNPTSTGALRTLKYDDSGRIESFLHTNANPALIASRLDQTFRYDDVGRLISFAGSGTTHAYRYDANGNRRELTTGANTYVNVIAPTSNWLKSAAGPLPSKINQFDLSGNLTGDGIITYTYGARGRMQTAKVGTVTAAYAYNGLGQRIVQTSSAAGSSKTGILNFDEKGHVIGEYDSASGRAAREFIYAGNVPVAVIEYSVQGSGPATAYVSKLFYVFTDHLDTPRVVTRATDDQVVWRWDSSDPFGMLAPNNNPAGQGVFDFPLRLPGQYADRTTNLFYNYYRDYDPQSGRYVQSDPIGLQGGINTYGYASANALRLVDPKGLAGMYVTFFGYMGDTGFGFHAPIGHAGVIGVNDITGATQYFDYGRYGGKYGDIRGPFDVGTLVFGLDGIPTQDSMNAVLSTIAERYGHGIFPSSVYDRDVDAQKIADFALDKQKDIANYPYTINPFSKNKFSVCYTFAWEAFQAGKK